MRNPLVTVTHAGAPPAAAADPHRQRSERRVPHRVACRLRISDSKTGDTVAAEGQTVNISADGLAVQLGKTLPEGTPVEVLLPQLDGAPIRVCGNVVHSRRVLTGTFEIGIRIRPQDGDS